jgi:ABC-2 type transport system ATP-binding protein
VLEVDQLVRTYGPVTALDGMSFTVAPGSVTGFLGPNGAGKTTTMRAVFGLTALDSGSVRYDGHAITQDDRRRFGYLPEERGLYATMKVAEQLRFLGQLRGMSRRDVDREATRWLEELGLGDRADAELEDLSLGNQQRVQLISALLHRPDVLILDAPFSGLDPVAVDALSKVLIAEAHRGATVLFSSHQLDLVEDLCERAVVVDRGRVVTEGTIDDLTAGADPVLEIDVPSDPDGTWTKELGAAPIDVISVNTGRVRMTLRAGPGTAAERADAALDAARRAGAVNHFAFDRRSLAEVFLSMVGRPVDATQPDAEEAADVRP